MLNKNSSSAFNSTDINQLLRRGNKPTKGDQGAAMVVKTLAFFLRPNEVRANLMGVTCYPCL